MSNQRAQQRVHVPGLTAKPQASGMGDGRIDSGVCWDAVQKEELIGRHTEDGQEEWFKVSNGSATVPIQGLIQQRQTSKDAHEQLVGEGPIAGFQEMEVGMGTQLVGSIVSR